MLYAFPQVDIPHSHRRDSNSHAKVWVSLSSSGHANTVYVGSHNISKAAWGGVSNAVTLRYPSVLGLEVVLANLIAPPILPQKGAKDVRILSYELGILIKDPKPSHLRNLPFDLNARSYESTDEPYCTHK